MTPPGAPARFARALASFVAAVVVAGLPLGCARHIGQQTAAGIATELRKQQAENSKARPIHSAAVTAVEGAVETLDAPAQRERIERLVSQAAAAAAHSAVLEATRQLKIDLGPDGQGPLAVSLTRTGERFASSAVGGVGSELAALAPECAAAPDALDCIERRLARTAHTTAASFTAGVKETLGWQLLLVAFVLGAAGGVVASWLWSLRHYRRRSLRMA